MIDKQRVLSDIDDLILSSKSSMRLTGLSVILALISLLLAGYFYYSLNEQLKKANAALSESEVKIETAREIFENLKNTTSRQNPSGNDSDIDDISLNIERGSKILDDASNSVGVAKNIIRFDNSEGMEQYEFDCSSRHMPLDWSICSDSEVYKLNTALAKEWFTVKSSLSGRDWTNTVNSQRRWMYETQQICGLPRTGQPSEEQISGAKICMKNAFEERLKWVRSITPK